MASPLDSLILSAKIRSKLSNKIQILGPLELCLLEQGQWRLQDYEIREVKEKLRDPLFQDSTIKRLTK